MTCKNRATTRRSLSAACCCIAATVLAFSVAIPAWGETIFLGPTPYRSAADSPFDLTGLGETFFLEDFEDGELNTPGVTQFRRGLLDDLGVVKPPSAETDSVDADDGEIDGTGTDGHSFESRQFGDLVIAPPIRVMSVQFQFDRDALGFLPTEVGFVLTDSLPISGLLSYFSVSIFESNDESGIDRDVMRWQPLPLEGFPDASSNDYFFGIRNTKGIERIKVALSYWGYTDQTGFEIDHLQYGLGAIPEPATGMLAVFLAMIVSATGCRIPTAELKFRF